MNNFCSVLRGLSVNEIPEICSKILLLKGGLVINDNAGSGSAEASRHNLMKVMTVAVVRLDSKS